MKRTAEGKVPDIQFPVVRFTDFATYFARPSDKSLGYYQPSAIRGLATEIPLQRR